jgi:hypothetical protein
MKNLLYLIVLFTIAILSFNCHKEPKPTFLGNWETVTTVGFKFEYQITAAQHCRQLPEYFGTTSFCYPYEAIDDNTIVVNANSVERWDWDFIGCDAASVTITSADSSKIEVILKRPE